MMIASRAGLRAAADGLLSVLFSPPCAVCGTTLASPTRGPVCIGCWESVRPLTPPLCRTCGDSLVSWRPITRDQATCPRCRRSHPVLASARAAGAYDGSLKAIIHAFKYDGLRSLGRPLAALMRDRGAGVLVDADLVVPVPLHWSRRRQRGFNQAADLAARLGLPVAHALRRRAATVPQSGVPAARRHANVRGAFELRRSGMSVAVRTVVIVDDVCTTGATLEACARVLAAAGCGEIRALTAARAVRTQP